MLRNEQDQKISYNKTTLLFRQAILRDAMPRCWSLACQSISLYQSSGPNFSIQQSFCLMLELVQTVAVFVDYLKNRWKWTDVCRIVVLGCHCRSNLNDLILGSKWNWCLITINKIICDKTFFSGIFYRKNSASIKKNVKYFSNVLHNEVCLCGGTANCRWNCFSLNFEHNLLYWLQMTQHQFSRVKETSSKISAPGYYPFKIVIAKNCFKGNQCDGEYWKPRWEVNHITECKKKPARGVI